MIIHYETIICDNCKAVQVAKVEHTIPFATWSSHCEPCGNWIGESEWHKVSTAPRDYCIKALARLKVLLNKSRQIIGLGINPSDFESDYSGVIEESIAVMLAPENDSNFERLLADISQWLYEGMVSIEDGENTVDVSTANKMVDYLMNYCN